MKKCKLSKLIYIITLICPLFLISCSESKEDNEKDKVEGINLNKGAIVENYNGEYKNLNIDNNEYIKINESKAIAFYDDESKNYIYSENNKYKAFYLGKEIELTPLKGNEIKYSLSPGGEYLSYFKKSPIEGIEGVYEYIPYIITLKDGKEHKIHNSISISGTAMEWLNEKEIIYYGVGKDKDDNITNGIIKYNVETKEEEELKNCDGGIIQFLKTTEDGIVFLEENFDNLKLLKLYNPLSKEEITLTDSLVTIYDVVKSNDNYYVLGSFKDDNLSLYKISEDGEYNRLIYNFPEAVREDRGLSVDEEGNVLIIGVSDTGLEGIYKCDEEDVIKKVSGTSKKQVEYTFVK